MTLATPYLTRSYFLNDMPVLFENRLTVHASAVPKEEDRIFMFIDLNNSTMLAERLGHIKYSLFLTSFFNDVEECRRQTGGDVYQFVGDEVIITWKFSLANIMKVITIATLLASAVNKKRTSYRAEFGHIPEFKVAVHHGKVAVTKIGKQRTYHGDVLNTCSRMLEVASQLKLGMVASQEIVSQIPESSFTELDDTSIRGKQNPVKIFSMALPSSTSRE